MRSLVRLLVILALLLSAAVVAPLTSATAARTAATPAATPAVLDTASVSPSSRDASALRPGGTAAFRYDATLRTSITERPTNPSLYRGATFRYTANRPGVKFRCTLVRPGRRGAVTCPRDRRQANPARSTGTVRFPRLRPSRVAYRFTVRAFIPAVVNPETKANVKPEILGRYAAYRWRIFSMYARDNYSPQTGPSFNRPLGDWSARRRNLTRVIRTIDSMPGYRQTIGARPAPCPTDPRLLPGKIRVTLYSMTDQRFANAMKAASRRCLSVQILMNNHLNRTIDPAWRTLVTSLGTSTRASSNGFPRRSFARRCSFGCRGRGVLHTKMYLFESTVMAPAQRRNRINDTVFVGSSNMTQNAAKVQWNDLYAVRGSAQLFRQYLDMFDRMKRDRTELRLRVYTTTNGVYQTTFWPQGRATDPTTVMFRSIRCRGANGGTGIGGKTVIYINMHAWFGTRGLAFANQVRGLYNRGCYVRVLYSFMSYAVFKKLRTGNNRMVARRTLFSDNGETASLYSHYKNIAVSGNVGADRSTRVVWTGSNNFTNHGRRFDEVMMRIRSGAAFSAYRNQWTYMRNRKSSSTYANFSEPTGGGRAPKLIARARTFAAGDQPPPGTPTIMSPDVTFDSSGEPRALD